MSRDNRAASCNPKASFKDQLAALVEAGASVTQVGEHVSVEGGPLRQRLILPLHSRHRANDVARIRRAMVRMEDEYGE